VISRYFPARVLAVDRLRLLSNHQTKRQTNADALARAIDVNDTEAICNFDVTTSWYTHYEHCRNQTPVLESAYRLRADITRARYKLPAYSLSKKIRKFPKKHAFIEKEVSPNYYVQVYLVQQTWRGVKITYVWRRVRKTRGWLEAMDSSSGKLLELPVLIGIRLDGCPGELVARMVNPFMRV
jgi:hypothetical protein